MDRIGCDIWSRINVYRPAEIWDSVIEQRKEKKISSPMIDFRAMREMVFPYFVPRAVSALPPTNSPSSGIEPNTVLSLSLSFSALIIKLPVFVWKVLLPRDNTWMLFECSRLSPAFPPKEWCNLADAFSYLSYLSAGRGTIYNRGN